MNTAEHILVLITCKDNSEAQHISAALVGQHLAACTNIMPNVRSVFHWKGSIEHEDEVLMMVKSQDQCLDRIVDVVKQEHSYDTPEIIALPIIGGSDEYLSWLVDETDSS